MHHWIIHSNDLLKNTDSFRNRTLLLCVAWKRNSTSAVALFDNIYIGGAEMDKVTANIVI